MYLYTVYVICICVHSPSCVWRGQVTSGPTYTLAQASWLPGPDQACFFELVFSKLYSVFRPLPLFSTFIILLFLGWTAVTIPGLPAAFFYPPEFAFLSFCHYEPQRYGETMQKYAVCSSVFVLSDLFSMSIMCLWDLFGTSFQFWIHDGDLRDLGLTRCTKFTFLYNLFKEFEHYTDKGHLYVRTVLILQITFQSCCHFSIINDLLKKSVSGFCSNEF